MSMGGLGRVVPNRARERLESSSTLSVIHLDEFGPSSLASVSMISTITGTVHRKERSIC
jgi:hypothetical protein